MSTLILTCNEEANIGSCLASLKWCDDVVVLDSGSQDRTVELAKKYGARIYEHRFEGFGSQRNWALDNIPFKYDWVLMLDADEETTEDFVREAKACLSSCNEGLAGLYVSRRFEYWGKWLKRSNDYPVWILRIVHRRKVRFEDWGHGERPEINGMVRKMGVPLIDRDLKPIEEWFARHNRYSTAEARVEYVKALNVKERLTISRTWSGCLRRWMQEGASRVPGRPLWYFLYAYLWRGGFLEGREGFYYCYMKAIYHAMIQIKKFDLGKRQDIKKKVL